MKKRILILSIGVIGIAGAAALFSGKPSSTKMRLCRGPSRYLFRSARLASQPDPTSPR